MANDDHAGYKKIQCWIPQELWDKIESLNYSSQTKAVTEAFDSLLNISQNIPNESQNIPELRATIEGLQMLLQEKDERITDLKKENDRLDFYAHYFKSIEHRRLEQPVEEIKVNVQEPVTSTASKPRVAREKILIRKTCKYCKKEFDALSDKAETCSSKCRQAFNRENKKSTATI